MSSASLQGRAALVTGVSRRRGIGFAIASRLIRSGADVLVTHHRMHDLEQPWGGDDVVEALVSELEATRVDPDQRVLDLAVDLAHSGAPEAAVHRAVVEFGHLDILVCNHAQSGCDGPIGDLTAGHAGCALGGQRPLFAFCWCSRSSVSMMDVPEGEWC